jgi:hypothetical protein
LCGRDRTPGVICRKSVQNPPSVSGRASWNSAAMFIVVVGLDTSTIGDLPDTVMDSSKPPTFS